MFPYVVCRSCGFPIGSLYNAYKFMLQHHNAGHVVIKGEEPGPNAPIGYILDALAIRKQCCRVAMMTNAEFRDYYNAHRPSVRVPTK